MMIDEMGIRLIDEFDVGEFSKGGKSRKAKQPAPALSPDGRIADVPPAARVKPVGKAQDEEKAVVEDEERLPARIAQNPAGRSQEDAIGSSRRGRATCRRALSRL